MQCIKHIITKKVKKKKKNGKGKKIFFQPTTRARKMGSITRRFNYQAILEYSLRATRKVAG